MWKVVNEQRGKQNSCNVDFTEVVKNCAGDPFSTKKDAVDAMNARFVGALRGACAPAYRLLRLRQF